MAHYVIVAHALKSSCIDCLQLEFCNELLTGFTLKRQLIDALTTSGCLQKSQNDSKLDLDQTCII